MVQMIRLFSIFLAMALLCIACSTAPSEEEQQEEENDDPPTEEISPPTDAIFTLDFEDHALGEYGEEDLAIDWNEPTWSEGIAEGRVAIVSDGAERGNVLQVFYPSGEYGTAETGAQWKLALDETYEELYVSFWIKCSDGFDFVKGVKIPGLVGGEANTGGNKPDGTDGWSARMMWRVDGRVVQYVYHPDQPSIYGEDFDWDEDFQRNFVPDTWHRVETRIAMNTPGENDGIIQSWFDGELALTVNTIRFRDVDTFGIDTFYFSTFFGGSNSSWSTSKDEYVSFDDFVISQDPITH